jgi:hypothetical protein
MLRFQIKDLLVSMTLISAGLGCFTAAIVIPLLESPFALVLYIGAGSLIGAGVLHPFKIAWVGAIIGTLTMMGLLLYIVATTPI